MDNGKYLNTLMICGRLKIRKDTYEKICGSPLDISKIFRLYIRYKKEDKLEIAIYILSFVMEHIKEIDKLEIVYKELLNMLEIGLKYDIILHSERSLEKCIYLAFSYINVDIVRVNYVSTIKDFDVFERCMRGLKNLRIVYVRAFENNCITLDGVRYKVEAGSDSTMYLDNGGKCYKGCLFSLIKLGLDKVSMLEYDKEKIKSSDIVSILKNRDDCMYIVRSAFMKDY